MGDETEKKPDAIEDVRKGLGLLFRAAKTAVTAAPICRTDKATPVTLPPDVADCPICSATWLSCWNNSALLRSVIVQKCEPEERLRLVPFVR